MPTDFYGRVMEVFHRYGMSMLQGAGTSLQIALVGTLAGCIIGFCRGCDPDHSLREGGQPHKAGGSLGNQGYPERLCGVLPGNAPWMAQAMFIWYGLMPLLGINSTIQQAAYFILSINTGAYMAETVRGGILSH